MSYYRKQPGIGARGTGKCGHPGEHVSVSLVVCDFQWCDGGPPSKPFVYPQNCAHEAKTRAWDGLESCDTCGKILRYP